MLVKEAMDVFGIKNTSEIKADLVKKRYNILAKKYHPDINKQGGTQEKFQLINEAHKILKNFGLGKTGIVEDDSFGIDAFDKDILKQIFANTMKDFVDAYPKFDVLFKDYNNALINKLYSKYDELIKTIHYVTKSNLPYFIDTYYTYLVSRVPKYKEYINNKNEKTKKLLEIISLIPSKYKDIIDTYNEKLASLSEIYNSNELEAEYNNIIVEIKNVIRKINGEEKKKELSEKVQKTKKTLESNYAKSICINTESSSIENEAKNASLYSELLNNLVYVQNGKRSDKKLVFYDRIFFNSQLSDKKYADYILGKCTESEKAISPKFIDDEEAIALGSMLYFIIKHNGKLYKLRLLDKDEILTRPLFDVELVDDEVNIQDYTFYKGSKIYTLADNRHSLYNPTAKDILAYVDYSKIKENNGIVLDTVPKIINDNNDYSYYSILHEGNYDIVKKRTR